MKKTVIMAVLCLAMANCGNNNEKNTQNEDTAQPKSVQQPVVEVEGRVNFGNENPVMTPMPCIMIATYDANSNPDVMMAAWGSQCGSKQICFELSPHKTTDNIRLKKAFTISFATAYDVPQSDYFGTVSANDVPDKVQRTGFTAIKSPNVDAPIIEQYKLTLECRAVSIEDYKDGGARVVGEVVNWSADQSIVTNGKVDINKLRPIIYNSADMSYYVVGDSVGKAWGSGDVYQKK